MKPCIRITSGQVAEPSGRWSKALIFPAAPGIVNFRIICY